MSGEGSGCSAPSPVPSSDLIHDVHPSKSVSFPFSVCWPRWLDARQQSRPQDTTNDCHRFLSHLALLANTLPPTLVREALPSAHDWTTCQRLLTMGALNTRSGSFGTIRTLSGFQATRPPRQPPYLVTGRIRRLYPLAQSTLCFEPSRSDNKRGWCARRCCYPRPCLAPGHDVVWG